MTVQGQDSASPGSVAVAEASEQHSDATTAGAGPTVPAVELVGVNKRYGKTTVLRDCSLQIERGQFERGRRIR